VQTVRVEVFDDQTRDGAERWQDYGFAGNPVDGQGLVIEAGGHTVVLRMDRPDGRPQLEPYDVAVWHKEGHRILLKTGREIVMTADKITLDAPEVVHTGKSTLQGDVQADRDITSDGTVSGAVDVMAGGVSTGSHTHPGVERGTGDTDPPTPQS
jgi:phage baseplate assembly protein V